MHFATGVFLLYVLAPPGCLSTVLREPERHKVVIVGAGVSGISAAASLLEHNVTDVIVLEASDRIGGRIHTVQYGGAFIDKGAEFVHGETNNAVFQMVKSYNLLESIIDKYFKPEKYFFTNTAGDDFNSTFVENVMNQSYSIFDSYQPLSENSTVADFFNVKMDEIFKNSNVDTKLGEAIRRAVFDIFLSEYASDNFTELGGSVFSEDTQTPGDVSLKWKQSSGGYKILFDMLTKKFPDPKEELPVLNKTLFDKQVTQIKYGEGKPVEVKCEDGSSYLADHVIVTVSLGVLKKHADSMFSPTLPQKKTDTIKALGMGTLGKVWLLFPKRWWPDNIEILIPLFSDDELQDFKNSTVHGYWTEHLSFLPVLGNERMLMIWMTGERCRTMETLTEDQITDGVMELLQRTLGKKFDIPRPESVMRTTWVSNPFTLGCYSFHSMDSDRQNLTNSDLSTPLLDYNKPVVLFAGEATHPNFYGTVHGALETGRREAQNLLNYLKNTSNELEV